MARLSRLCIVVTIALAATAGTALAADHIGLRPAGGISLDSLGKILFDSSLVDIECDLTFTGQLDEGVDANVEGTVTGAIQGGEAEGCEGMDTMNFLALGEEGEGWPITLSRPATESSIAITIRGFNWEFVNILGGLDCLYLGNQNATISLSEGLAGLLTSSANSLSRAAGQSFFCPPTIRVVGSFELAPQQTVELI